MRGFARHVFSGGECDGAIISVLSEKKIVYEIYLLLAGLLVVISKLMSRFIILRVGWSICFKESKVVGSLTATMRSEWVQEVGNGTFIEPLDVWSTDYKDVWGGDSNRSRKIRIFIC